MTVGTIGSDEGLEASVEDKGDGRCGNVSEYRTVNGRETLGPSAPSAVIDHESQWPNSDGFDYLNRSP